MRERRPRKTRTEKLTTGCSTTGITGDLDKGILGGMVELRASRVNSKENVAKVI